MPIQNSADEFLSPEEKEARGILLAQEITALRKENTQESQEVAIAKAQELERLFAPQAIPENEPELYSTTELTLEDGAHVLIRPENFSIQKDSKTHNLFPGSTFKLSGVRVRFKGLVDTTDPNTENHNKPVIEIDIAAGGGLHQIIEPATIEIEGSDFWSWEKLTPEVIEQQLAAWQTVYNEIGLTEVNLPSNEALLAYLSDNQEFIELMQRKEQQGFTQMVIAPLKIKDMIDKLNTAIKAHGGTDQYLSDTWKEMLKDETKTHYFVNLGQDQGSTISQIQAKPEDFGVLNGCFVSFVEPRQNIVKRDEPDVTDPTGRKAIKGGLNAQAYQDKYFSGADPNYQGEQAMIPQEWLASFAADLYNKYLKDNRQMDASTPVTNLMDAATVTWFTSTSVPGRGDLPYAYWNSDDRQLYFHDYGPASSSELLAPRPSVRKKS